MFANLGAPFNDLISWPNAFRVIKAQSLLLISVALVSPQEVCNLGLRA